MKQSAVGQGRQRAVQQPPSEGAPGGNHDAGAQVFKGERERWVVEREGERGGAGRIWYVRGEGTLRQAVLKELDLGTMTDWKSHDLFQRELAVLKQLAHPGIPQVLDVVPSEIGPPAIVQTRVFGDTLQTIIDRGVPLSEERFTRALRDCLRSLVYLHGQVPPLIHRDITPRNVMLDDTRAWLIDFGSVKASLRENTQITSVGTFGFMAPEQTRGRAEPASDLFSLGMTFVSLATGMEPARFDVDGATGQVNVATTLGQTSKQLKQVLEKMTRPGLGERFKTAREALAALDSPEWKSEPSSPAALAELAGEQDAAPWQKALMALLGACLLGIVLFFITFRIDWGSRQPEFGRAVGQSESAVEVTATPFSEPTYVRVEPGTYVIGSPESETEHQDWERQHSVTLTRPFLIQTTEVTQWQWQKVMQTSPSDDDACGPRCAVESVTWDDAIAFVNKLSTREGLEVCYPSTGFVGLQCLGYRLPTEAEWEVAARAGERGPVHGGVLDEVAWHDGNANSLKPVALKKPNAWGLYDVMGNVKEWVHDGPGNYGADATDPVGSHHSEKRMYRGGNWSISSPNSLRLAYRGSFDRDARRDYLGFRVARTAAP
jgi:formylglycine-generating enzyme required for sulfatase activity